MENENQEKIEIGLTKGPRLEIRSARRGKITEDETIVEKVIKSAKFGEIRTQDVEKSYFVEYPTLGQPAGPFGSRYAADQRLKELRDADTECLGTAKAARLYAVAQGIARRVKTCEREVTESAKLIPEDIRDEWTDAMIALRQACERVREMVPYEEIWAAYCEQQADKESVA